MTENILRILLVDDDEDDRHLFKKAIDELRIETDLILLESGIKLMDYVNDPITKMPSIIFLDLNMPIKNGMECLKELRVHPRTKNVTIAIYSTSSSEKDIENTFVYGANIYINKPYSFGDLKTILNKVLTLNWQYHKSNLNKKNFLLKI